MLRKVLQSRCNNRWGLCRSCGRHQNKKPSRQTCNLAAPLSTILQQQHNNIAQYTHVSLSPLPSNVSIRRRPIPRLHRRVLEQTALASRPIGSARHTVERSRGGGLRAERADILCARSGGDTQRVKDSYIDSCATIFSRLSLFPCVLEFHHIPSHEVV